jgi:hypothetical protein
LCGIEFQAVIGVAIGHVKDMYHALALFSRMAQASFGKIYPPTLPLNSLWEAAQPLAGVSKIVGYDTNVFVDADYIFHFVTLRLKSYKKIAELSLIDTANGFKSKLPDKNPNRSLKVS